MSDLISREAAIKMVLWGGYMAAALAKVEALPTIDAEPVRHGKWDDLCRGKVRLCSCCKHHFDNTCNDIDGNWIFCPNCGAKMDLEDAK